MSAQTTNMNELQEEIAATKSLIAAAKRTKETALANLDMASLAKNLTAEELLKRKSFLIGLEKAENVIKAETAKLMDLEQQLRKIAPCGRTSATGSVSSVASEVKRKELEIKQRGLALLHEYQDEKEKLELEKAIQLSKPDSAEKEGELNRLDIQLRFLESSYTRKKKQLDESGKLEVEIIQADEFGLRSLGDDFPLSDDDHQDDDKVNQWQESQKQQHDHHDTSYLPRDTGMEMHRQYSPVQGEQQQDKDTLLIHLMQTQLSLMNRSSGSVTDKKLPDFSGDPKDWNAFKSAYDRTCRKYHFEDDENLSRLQSALKGEAKLAVEHLMANVSNVQKIMEILERRFGRSEFIIDHLIEKVKECAKPDMLKPKTIVDFGTAVENLVVNVHAYKELDYLASKHLVNELIDKLPGPMRDGWFKYLYQDATRKANLQTFATWLEEPVGVPLLQWKPMPAATSKQEEKGSARPKRNFGSVNATTGEEKGSPLLSCPACGKAHGLDNCWALKKKTLDERWNIVKTARVCFTCLKDNHITKDCPENKPCGKDGCTRSHHRLLHSDFKKPNRSSTPQENEIPPAATNANNDDAARNAANPQEPAGNINMAVSIIEGTDGPLPIVPVRVKGRKGIMTVHVMLDSGATRTLIRKKLAADLGLEGPTLTYRYQVPPGRIVESKGSQKVNLSISGRYRNAKWFPLTDCITVDENGVAPYSINVERAKLKWPHLRRFQGPSLTKVVPDIVIGGDHGFLHMHMDLLYSSPAEPVAMRTVLGWIMQGKLGVTNQIGSSFHIGGAQYDEYLDKLIIESFQQNGCSGAADDKLAPSIQDKRALEIMESTTCQRNDGRWETGLLWKNNRSLPSSSYQTALNRLLDTEKKMIRNPDFANVYRNKIAEYLEKGYIRKLSEKELGESSERTCYVPHFGVTNPHKPGKFRLVFDCAAKFRQESLNDFLLTGPDLNQPLTTVLWNFRVEKVVICGDIEDMFHRVFIRKEDRAAQRFLWRDDTSSSSPSIYELLVMMFGSTCSPSCAWYVKNRNANQFADTHPKAVSAIVNDMYADDNLTVADAVEEAVKLRHDITEINAKGGFAIKKWISNSQEIMESIPEELRSAGSKGLFERGLWETERVLGLYWDPQEDAFTFKINFSKVKPEVLKGRRPTKREMCSLVMSLYDPIGFVVHYKIKGMILFQSTWKCGIGWDDEIPEDLYENWKSWVQQLPVLEEIRIPRCYSFSIKEASIQLHTFVDASSEATSCVCYLRVQYGSQVEVAFVASKVNVAPSKKSTIPRLELCEAVRGSKLANRIQRDIRVKIDGCVFWSDSATVLSWIKSESAHYKEYVANRIVKIHGLTDRQDWRWIGTAENVADDGTRLLSEVDLSSGCRWLGGPAFLALDEIHWPQKNIGSIGVTIGSDTGMPEEHEMEAGNALEIVPAIKRFSRFYRLLRATAAVIGAARFWKSKSLRKEKGINSPWTKVDGEIKSRFLLADLISAKKTLTLAVQQESEVKKLGAANRKFTLMKDANGIVRVTGRIPDGAGVQEEARLPILLPRRHHFVDLLSADETLMAISRFVDSCGLPRHFYSDNGTNYQAAANECEKREKYHGAEWHFIPPASPHMRGAWETMVKQVKKVLHVILKEKNPRDQCLLTALRAVENILNSRPLSYVSSDIGDPEAITPNHFLRGPGVASEGNERAATTGSPLMAGDLNDHKVRWGKQWEKAQVLAKQFWQRWSKEVLPDLLRRNKWNVTKEPIKVGDVVIMLDDTRPRSEWKKAVVTKTFPGKDGAVRVVEVVVRGFMTKPTFYRRAVAKVCPTGIRCCDLATVQGLCPNQGAGNGVDLS